MKKLALQYITQIKSWQPSYKCVFESSFTLLFEARPSDIPSMELRMMQHMSYTGMKCNCIAKFFFLLSHLGHSDHPCLSWTSTKSSCSQSGTPPEVFKSEVDEISVNYDGYQRIHMDGSKARTNVASAAISWPCTCCSSGFLIAQPSSQLRLAPYC